MKKLLALLLALVMLFSLSACGEKEEKPDIPKDDNGKIDAEELIDDALEETEELNSFSVAAVERFFLKAAGLSFSLVEPAWKWNLKNDYCAYADDPSNGFGHGVIQFTKEEGELTAEEYQTWLEKVFAATAAASQDGYNIIGYEFAGEGENALDQTTLEAAMEGFMQGWVFRYNDRMMTVYVSQEYDSDKESQLGSLLYYDSVELDIGFGMEMSWDDLEDYMEENEDEINDAIEDLVGG